MRRYLPKSKVQIKRTIGGELMYLHNQGNYVGYYIESSDGKYYEGRSNTNFGKELVLQTTPSPEADVDLNYFNDDFDVDPRKFNIINENLKLFFEKTRPIPSQKTRPTDKDKAKGFYKRYFVKRVNGSKYLEINSTTYSSITSREGKYDHNLYVCGTIMWYIRGNVHKLNAIALKKVGQDFPRIATLFPILNEFHYIPSTTPTVEENLYTSGGELFYSNGTTYIGDYHVHSTKGPMEGATHTDSPHNTLYYTNDLPLFPNQTYEEFIQEYNKIDCYECKTLQGNNVIFKTQVSRIIGCPEGSYEEEILASKRCFEDNFEELEVEDDTINRPTDTISYNTNTNTSPTNTGPNISSGGGGTSGGGGGGY